MTPKFKRHLSDMQSRALTIQVLLGGLDRCLNDPTLKGLAIELVESMSGLAKEIANGLDSVNLPEMDGAA